MLTQLNTAAVAGLLPHVEGVKQPPTAPPHFTVNLYTTEALAVALAADIRRQNCANGSISSTGRRRQGRAQLDREDLT